MNINEAYRILNISEKSSLNEVKKAFRKEILRIHPDLNNSNIDNERVKVVIEAYKVLSNILENRENENTNIFYDNYKKIFNSDFNSDSKSILKMLKNVFLYIDRLLYKTQNREFFSNLVNRYINILTQNEKSIYNYTIAILENINFILEIINQKKVEKINENDYYQIEKIRINFIKLFKEAFSINNYLDFRYFIINNKNIYLKDSIFAINSISNTKLRQEIFSYMTIISLLSEEEFLDNIIIFFG